MSITKISKDQVKIVESLSKLQLDEKEENYITRQFNETLSVVDNLNKLDTKKTPTTNQVTGLVNVFRQDKVDKKRQLTQEEALSNTKKKYCGYFVTSAVFNDK